MSDYYDRAGRPVTVEEWIDGFDIRNRRVARTELGKVTVSTVHLGLNHQYGDGPPLIFETMVLGGEHDWWCDRYSTEEQACAGHAAVVAWLRGEGPEPGGGR